MLVPDHLCLYGLKSKDLLEREGHEVDDHHLTTREETDTFKAKYDVKTTPQTFIGKERIGGYDDLSAHFGNGPKKQDATTYQLVIALFSVVALMAIAVTYLTSETVFFRPDNQVLHFDCNDPAWIAKNFRTSKNSQRCF